MEFWQVVLFSWLTTLALGFVLGRLSVGKVAQVRVPEISSSTTEVKQIPKISEMPPELKLPRTLYKTRCGERLHILECGELKKSGVSEAFPLQLCSLCCKKFV